jgi:hypothetical protein
MDSCRASRRGVDAMLLVDPSMGQAHSARHRNGDASTLGVQNEDRGSPPAEVRL